MATDETGKTPVTLYTSLETFCVVADVSGIKPGALVRAIWIAASAQGVAPNTKINTSDYVYKSGVAHLYFKLATWDESNWPIGSYRVDLFLDGVKAAEQSFSVQ